MELHCQRGYDSQEASARTEKGVSSVSIFTWGGDGLVIQESKEWVAWRNLNGFLRIPTEKIDFCQLLKQVSKPTKQLPWSWRWSSLQTSCLLDKQSKPLESVEREGCGQCLWLTAHSEELRKQGYELEKSFRFRLLRQKGVQTTVIKWVWWIGMADLAESGLQPFFLWQ